MTLLLMILLVGPLAATGIYNPHVVVNGHCIAEPGSFKALYCGPAPAAHHLPQKVARSF